MRVFLLSLITFAICSEVLAQQQGSFHRVNRSLEVVSQDGMGKVNLPPGTFVREKDPVKNLGNWWSKVILVDDNNNAIGPGPMTVSRTYLNKAVKVNFKNPIELMNSDGKTIMTPPDSHYVKLRLNKGSWNYYEVIMVNENGETITQNGNVTPDGEKPPVFKVSQSSFNQQMLENGVREAIFLHNKIQAGKFGPQDRPCPQNAAPPTSSRPKRRPDDLRTGEYDLLRGGSSPYQTIMEKRDGLLGHSTSTCLSRLRALEDDLLAQTPWGDMSLGERAQKIGQIAETVDREVRNAAEETGEDRPSSSRYRDSVNPHRVLDVITPELISCLSFQETSRKLNPFSQNYTYCNSTQSGRMISTAHGLGQMTSSTMRLMKGHPEGDQIPPNTPWGEKYAGMSYRDIHQEMSRDPYMQIEVIMRTINQNAKHARWRENPQTTEELLKHAVEQYDQDDRSRYMRNVFQCLDCLENQSYSECYHDVWN